jgi:hypothetical protein
MLFSIVLYFFAQTHLLISAGLASIISVRVLINLLSKVSTLIYQLLITRNALINSSNDTPACLSTPLRVPNFSSR